MRDLSKYTVPTSFVGITVPTKVMGMPVVSAIPTKVVRMQAVYQGSRLGPTSILLSEQLWTWKLWQHSSHGTEDLGC